MVFGLLVACGEAADDAPASEGANPTAVSADAATSTPPLVTAVPTPIPPTPTPQEPLVAMVNGQPITLALYEKELARYQQAFSAVDAPNIDYEAIVLDSLIRQELTRQAALNAGIVVSDTAVDQELSSYINNAGGQENFDAWLEANLYTADEFRAALRTSMLEGQIVADITANIPTTAEQVNARYIKLADQATAEAVLAQLQAGADFAQLAAEQSVDTLTGTNGGEIGYFAEGWLMFLPPVVEETAFSLAVGERSGVLSGVESDGMTYFYVVETIDRDPQRPLPSDIRQSLQQQAVDNWLQTLQDNAEITLFSN